MLDPNIYDNHCFRLWDYGVGPHTNYGSTKDDYFANRHRMEGAGAEGVMTLAPGTTPSDTSIRKWIRGVECLDITVSPSFDPDVDARQLRTRTEGFVREAPADIAFRILVFGDEDAEFWCGIEDESIKVTCKGPNELVSVKEHFPVGNLGHDWLLTTYFERPTPGASFKIVGIWGEVIWDTRPETPWCFRRRDLDRLRCQRFALPLTGLRAETNGAGGQIVVTDALRQPMRTIPSIRDLGGAGEFVQATTGQVYTAADPALSLDTDVTTDSFVRFSATGFTSPSAPASATRGAIRTMPAVLHADY